MYGVIFRNMKVTLCSKITVSVCGQFRDPGIKVFLHLFCNIYCIKKKIVWTFMYFILVLLKTCCYNQGNFSRKKLLLVLTPLVKSGVIIIKLNHHYENDKKHAAWYAYHKLPSKLFAVNSIDTRPNHIKIPIKILKIIMETNKLT